jgi:galacturan 1,4-alpha-galacturonidase
MRATSLLGACVIVGSVLGYVVNNGTECYLYPESLTHFGQPVDDSPSIQQAFELCGTNGTVIFTANDFHINQVMNTTNLLNCEVKQYGNLIYSTNVPYWLSHSYNVGLQNQSTAWLFGGTNVTFLGLGGHYDGNGQTWYTENRNNSNQPGRPISITFYNSTNLRVDGLRIIQQQFWATFVSYSQNVVMTNIYINATSNDNTRYERLMPWVCRKCSMSDAISSSTVNTDGSDTWNSRDITYTNWTVTTGDDCIAAKGNTTNLHVQNVTCYGGAGMTIGSVGKSPDLKDSCHRLPVAVTTES